MRIPRTKEGSSLCVGRAGSVRPGSARRASVCAPAPSQGPGVAGSPGSSPRPAAPAPHLQRPLRSCCLGATAAGSPLPDAARAAPATVARETKLHRPVTSPRGCGGPEGAGSSERGRGRGGPGGGRRCGEVRKEARGLGAEVLTVLRAERSAQRGTFRSPAGELSRGTVPHLECLWKM